VILEEVLIDFGYQEIKKLLSGKRTPVVGCRGLWEARQNDRGTET
jgi:hypothetical protein